MNSGVASNFRPQAFATRTAAERVKNGSWAPGPGLKTLGCRSQRDRRSRKPRSVGSAAALLLAAGLGGACSVSSSGKTAGPTPVPAPLDRAEWAARVREQYVNSGRAGPQNTTYCSWMGPSCGDFRSTSLRTASFTSAGRILRRVTSTPSTFHSTTMSTGGTARRRSATSPHFQRRASSFPVAASTPIATAVC